MKDHLLNLVRQETDQASKLNVMREYLQIYALRSFFENGFFSQMAFVGGTALRFIFNVPRFSEDLDFSLTKKEGYDFEAILNKIKQSFLAANYLITIKFSAERTVHTAFLKFPELMHLAGLSHKSNQNLSIKFDIDINPPTGGVLSHSLINKYFPITFTHYDLPSLFSGKLHAILTRPYVKGRDYFDLVWLLSRFPDLNPNIALLTNALKQTHNPLEISLKNWKAKVLEKVEAVDWTKVLADVERFAEDSKYMESMRPDAVRSLLI